MFKFDTKAGKIEARCRPREARKSEIKIASHRGFNLFNLFYRRYFSMIFFCACRCRISHRARNCNPRTATTGLTWVMEIEELEEVEEETFQGGDGGVINSSPGGDFRRIET